MENLTTLPDERLVEKICSTNQDWYAEVIRRYQSKIERYVRATVKDGEMARDAVQETFIKAFINLRSFDSRRKFSNWIYRLAHNEAVNQLRKVKNEIRLPENIDIRDETLDADSERIFSQKETSDLVEKLIGQLPVNYAEPLALAYLEDKSYNEISDILRLPVNTVGVRINRAKKMMKQLWLEQNH